MNRFFKKSIIFFVLSFFLFNILISGCNSYDQKHEEESSESVNEKAVTLKFYFSGQENPDSEKVLNEIENRTNLMLDFEWIPFEERQSKLDALFSSGDDFDALASLSDGDYNPEFYKLSGEDRLLNITELFPRCATNLYKKYTPEELMLASYKGKIMGVPSRMPLSLRMSVTVREDLMEKHGIDEIKSLEDYEAYLEAINEDDVKIPSATWLNTIYLFAQMYGYFNISENLVFKPDDPDMKLIPWEQTSGFREAFNTLKRWNEKGYIDNPDSIENSMMTGNLGSLFTPWVVADYFLRSVPEKEYKMISYALYRDKPVRRLSNTAAIIVLNKNAQNPERTLGFLDWVQSAQENYDLLMYGLEGEHYTLKGQSVVFPKDKNKYSGWNGSAVFENIDYIRLSESFPPDYWKTFREIVMANTEFSPADGFIPDTGSIIDLIRQRQENFSSFEDYIQKGLFDSIDVDDYINKQKEAGVDIIIATLQRQLNKWRKSK